MGDRSAERWRQVEKVLDAALERTAGERPRYLDEACAADTELRTEVEQLLRACDRAEAFLEQPASQLAAGLLAAVREAGTQPPTPEGTRVGPYRIVREVGHGGMGTVYLAERDDEQFRQRVALKVVRGGIGSEYLVRRFLEERQILASLDHPRIARLLDGGVTADGMPYFAMEYVEGTPIDRYCDEHRLAVEARLQLIMQVCDAVQYAHRNLVVHRDLKPLNILVTADGEVKLLDFGIAKLLAPDRAAAEGLTRTGMRLLTPNYASPEQVRGEVVTTASDVYSLGIVLYELLTGRHPYATADAPPREMERRILEVEPQRPSSAVRHAHVVVGDGPHATAEQVAAARDTTLPRLQNRLRGDLNTMVLKALRKEPARRYLSAQQLGEDIARHLGRRPVLAQRDTFSYRAATFVRRNRVALLAASSVIALGVGFATYHVIEVARERDGARREAAKAEHVSRFLVDLFEGSDPYGPASGEPSLADLLAVGARRLERELTDQPEVRAAMMSTIGRVYSNLGRFDSAGRLFDDAFAIRQRSLPRGHPDLARSLADLGALQYQQGNYPAADSLFAQALARLPARPGAMPAEEVEVRSGLAVLRTAQNRYEAADSLHQMVLALRRAQLGPSHTDVALSLSELGIVARRRGDQTAAETFHRQALAINRAQHGHEHASVAENLQNLALALHSQDRYAEAETLYREALELQTRLLGAVHPKVASTMNSLAALLEMKGDLAAAEPLYREALAIRQQLLGPEHPDIARSMDQLGGLLHEKGDRAGAEPLVRGALEMRRRLLPPDHPSVATSLNALALLRRDRGKYAEAGSLFGAALAIYRARLGPTHPFVARALSNLASVELRQHRYQAADALYRESVDILRTASPPLAQLADPLIGLGEVRMAQGRSADAEPLLREAVAIRRARLPTGHWMHAAAGSTLGACLSVLGRADEAEPLLVSGHAALEAARGAANAYTLQSRQALADHRARARRRPPGPARALLPR